MTKNKTKNRDSCNILLHYIVVPLICFLISIYLFFWNQNDEYHLMCVLPIVFLVCYELFLRPSLKLFREFDYVYSIVSFVRFVILPALIVFSGRYDGRSVASPSSESFKIAFLLMCYELIVCSIFIFFYGKKLAKVKKESSSDIEISRNKWFYYIFIIISLALAFVNPKSISALSFITPNENAFNYHDFGIIEQVSILFLIVGKNLLFVLLINNIKKKYNNNPRTLYVLVSVSLVLLNSSIFFGTNRFDFVLNLAASTMLFCIIFKKYRNIIISIMTVFCIVGFLSITQVRDNYHSVSGNKNIIYDMTDSMQVYLGGPYNIAMAVETAEMYPEGRNFKTAIYDLTRPVLGLNIFVRDIENVKLTSHYFNWRIFYRDHPTQIIPMIGEGYYLFGFIFSPILEIMFITIAYFLRKTCIRKNDMIITFFFLITLIRLGFINCQSATIQMNDLSFNLFLPILVYFINNNLFAKKQNIVGVKKEG